MNTKFCSRPLLSFAVAALLSVTMASSAVAAPAFLAHVGNTANRTGASTFVLGTSNPTDLSSAVAAGNTVIVALALDPTGTTVTCADTKGNTYTKDEDFSNGSGTSGTRVVIFSAPVTTALAVTDEITVTFGANVTAKAMSVNAFSGLVSASIKDKSATGSGTTAAVTTALTATTSQASELLFGAFADEDKSNVTLSDPAGNFTMLTIGTTGTSGGTDTHQTILPEFRVVAATGTYRAEGTRSNTPTTPWAGAIVTYKATVEAVCGNGAVEAGEQCDDGNTANGDCCSSTCQYEANGAACTSDANVCTNDVCNATGTCEHNNNTASCTDNVFCNGTDTCSGGTCSVHAGDPCVGTDGDGNCSESCDEAADNCLAADPNGSSCDDGAFCNGLDTCSGGTCSNHTGDPCSGPDGDANCSETCNEAADDCGAPDPDGAACTNGLFCDGADTCVSGACTGHAGDPCQGPDGDGNCAESCNEGSDSCNAADPNGAACDDGAFCNGLDTCSGGTCSGHTGDPCTGEDGDADCSESCNEAAEDCTAADSNGSTCDDGTFCNGNDTCSDGSCSNHTGDPCSGPDGDANCSETCDEAADDCGAADTDGSSCTDALFCNGADTCVSGACTGHAGDPCPGADGDANCSESCDEGSDDCSAADADESVCDDGTFCNGDDTCNGGTCSDHTGDPCLGPDGDGDCYESCNESSDDCTAADADGSVCDDGDACTDPDTCDGGSCGGATVDCDDGNECSTDTCDTGTGCVNEPVGCDDNDECTTDTCDDQTGCAHDPVSCDDNDECTTDTCDEVTGCGHTPVSCHDNNECTTDTCDAQTGCAHDPVECNDDDACTTDTCDETLGCEHDPIGCDDGSECTADTCDSETGCVNDPVGCDDGDECTVDTCDDITGCAHDQADCDDGDACTDDSCDSEAGCGHTPVSCDDNDECTTDTCDEQAGCAHEPVGCDDGNECTTDTCDAETGCSNEPVDCEDENPCTIDSCEHETGTCVNEPKDCDDGQYCNGPEVCEFATGDCVPGGEDPSCDDSITCTFDACDFAANGGAGGCSNTDIEDCCATNADCSNSDACDGEEFCDETQECQEGIPVTCNDGELCTTDTCDHETGACSYPEIDGCCTTDLECEDPDLCTTDTCDLDQNICQHLGTDCDDENACTVDSCGAETGACEHEEEDCNDGLDCTLDTCDALEGCAHDPIDGCCLTDGDCNDETVCNGTRTCNLQTHACEDDAGPLDCTDSDPCTDDTCDPVEGCNHPDEDCDDGLFCTTDSCDSGSGCQNEPVPECCESDADCEDENVCDGVNSCVSHTCTVVDSPDCTDGSVCTIDTCDETQGCVHEIDPLCESLDIRRLRVNWRPGSLRRAIRAQGAFIVPPDLTGGPITVQIQDGIALDVTHVFNTCTGSGTAVKCKEGHISRFETSSLDGQQSVIRFKLVLRNLDIMPPFGLPVVLTLTHDSVDRVGTAVYCRRSTGRLRCG